MSKNIFIPFLLFLFFASNQILAQKIEDYHASHQSEFEEALLWVKNHKQLIIKYLGQDAKKILSIAFPELVRYKAWQDFLEMSSLEIAYVSEGSQQVDFSVGCFQIKPSFVEYLESQQKNYFLEERYAKYLNLNHLEKKQARKKRLERLKTPEAQLAYLKIFYKMAQQKFPHLQKLSEKKQLIFLANLYNAGLQCSVLAIEKLEKQKKFPYGKRYKGTQYNYGEISWYFYQHFGQVLLAR